jgi:anaerobic selenocysteine-containing dehydrogenase
MDALRDHDKIKCHVALTPTWNESAWFADYVLPMGHAGERHDIMSQETHSGRWIGFRQPVQRVAREAAGQTIHRSYEANPGQVWEEAEFWIDLSWAMDPDGSLGIRQYFESPSDANQPISMDEYFGWIFDHSVPGLPESAAAEGLTPLAYMRKYGAYEISAGDYLPYEAPQEGGVEVGGVARRGFTTPSGRLEFFSPTLRDWGWPEQAYAVPWPLRSHVAPEVIDIDAGEMLLLPNFRLPTLIHTRSANAKWLYELSHKNPVWMHPDDAERLGIEDGGLVRIETEIGGMVDRIFITHAIKPGIIAISHHLGRWRLKASQGVGAGMSSVVGLSSEGMTNRLRIEEGAASWVSSDPDTSRIWWNDVGVHQNLTHAVHPDPISGAHCWHQKATRVCKALPGDQHGDVWVDQERSMAVYREWLALARPATTHSPDGTRRPKWLKRPLRPVDEAYALPDS